MPEPKPLVTIRAVRKTRRQAVTAISAAAAAFALAPLLIHLTARDSHPLLFTVTARAAGAITVAAFLWRTKKRYFDLPLSRRDTPDNIDPAVSAGPFNTRDNSATCLFWTKR